MKRVMQEITKEERVRKMSYAAFKIEEFVYKRTLTNDMLDLKKSELVNLDMMINLYKKEKLDQNRSYSAKIRLKEQLREDLLHEIFQKEEEVREKVWQVRNLENATMEYINEEGEVVYSRPIVMEERQLRINQIDFSTQKSSYEADIS